MLKRNIIFILFALIFSSCEYTDSPFRYNVGNDFVENNSRMIMIDTLTINTYTTAIDSLYTSRSDRFLAGRYQNSLGIITYCESYFRLDPSEIPYFHESSVYDSACFILNIDGYNFGDTTKICKFNIFRVIEEIDVDNETDMIYSTKQFKHEDTPLASFSLDLTDEYTDSVCVRLPDAFGKELYDLAYNEGDDMDGNSLLEDPELFKEKYKGFLIKPEDGNISCVVGFTADPDTSFAPRIRVYYNDFTFNDDLSIVFPIENYSETTSTATNYYSSIYIKNDYSNFFINNIPTDDAKTSSELTGNVTLLQGGTNLRTRIEIPYINDLYYLGIGSVIKAELYIRPVNGTFENVVDLPDSLEMYITDQKNRNLGQMYNVGTTNKAYAFLHYDAEFKHDTYYSFDISQYLVDEYMDKGDPRYSLLLALPQSDINNNVNQLIIGDPYHPTNDMTMKVYLATYN